ncbi:serine/threonine-protein kinase [Actinoplanes auranticolor]|uniref:serine/threonine-protein kinase n=1 Tax=Actinoplanes auranticolor TaxID=47988 RepID=UPI001BB3DF71|nr:serine/threonine-protein kinase [Actinoplanes auranticolor]
MAKLPMGTAILRRYVLIGAIGQGGVSTVYSAVDARQGRKLAVKVLAPSLADDAQAREDVRREALITDRLRHPSVPRVFEYGEAPLPDGSVVPYVVLELLAGVPLTERLARGRLEWPEAVRIAATAADVLAVAHRRGVVHRDLSARNIMVSPAGIKIIDFGLATAALRSGDSGAHPVVIRRNGPRGDTTRDTLSRSAAVHGAPRRDGPKHGGPKHGGLRRGGQDHSGLDHGGHDHDAGTLPSHPKTAFARPADDVYTLGVLLYEMLTGRSPYPPAVAAMIVTAGRAGHLAPTPVLAIPGLPPPLRDLVRACMAKRPEDRPLSVDVALDLWRILDGVHLPEPSIN